VARGEAGAMTAAPSSRAALAGRTFRRILLIKPSSLGDLVHALPVLHGLRRRYPQARIDWLAGTSFAPLIEGHPDLDEVIRFDRRRYGKMLRDPRVAAEFVAFLADLRQRRYDLVVDLQALFRSGFMALATGAGVRVGFANAREFGWAFYTHRIRPDRKQTHAVDRNYLVAGLLGFADVPVRFDLAVTDGQRDAAAWMLADAGVDAAGSFAAVLPGARWETKRWGEARFAELIDRLNEEHSLPCVLLAGADEADICRRIETRCRRRPPNLAGRTTLRELIGVLERAAIVVCHDSAPMHLAAALDRPMVCLLGPTNPARTGPYNQEARVLQSDWPCVPCYLRRLSQCGYEHRCMTALDVGQVLEAILAVRNRTEHGAASFSDAAIAVPTAPPVHVGPDSGRQPV